MRDFKRWEARKLGTYSSVAKDSRFHFSELNSVYTGIVQEVITPSNPIFNVETPQVVHIKQVQSEKPLQGWVNIC